MSACDTLVFYVERMPTDVGAAAFLSILDNVRPVEQTIKAANRGDGFADRIDVSTRHVLLIGTFWNSQVERLARVHQGVTFHVYAFGDLAPFPGLDNVKVYPGAVTGHGPASFVVDFVRRHPPSLIGLFEGMVKVNERALAMIDDRAWNRNLLDNQPFFTGMHNLPEETGAFTGSTLFQRFKRLFGGQVSVDEVIRLGRVIFEAQLGMTRERARTNSKQMMYQGKLLAVTDAPDLINLTHDALTSRYPDADVTVAVSIKLDNDEPDRLSFSLRSHKVNAASLARQFGGDGNPQAAGGSIPHPCPIPFTFEPVIDSGSATAIGSSGGK